MRPGPFMYPIASATRVSRASWGSPARATRCTWPTTCSAAESWGDGSKRPWYGRPSGEALHSAARSSLCRQRPQRRTSPVSYTHLMATQHVPGLRSSARGWFDPPRWLASVYLSACNQVGPGTRTIGRPLVHNQGRISIGRDTTLRSLGSPVRLTATSSGTISIGDGVVIDTGATLFSESSVRVGDGAVIGPNVLICDCDEEGHRLSLIHI